MSKERGGMGGEAIRGLSILSAVVFGLIAVAGAIVAAGGAVGVGVTRGLNDVKKHKEHV